MPYIYIHISYLDVESSFKNFVSRSRSKEQEKKREKGLLRMLIIMVEVRH